MFTAAWDEPFAIPTEESATLALRTQQILAYETGVARVADPLGGSYYVEALTDAMEGRVVEIMDDLERKGGMVRAIEDGVLQRMISEEAFRVDQAVRSGERTVVGVNTFETDERPPETEGYELDEKGRIRQLERLAEVKRTRSAADVKVTLGALSAAAAKDSENLVPLLVVGGTIPERDVPRLEAAGAAAVYPTGTPLESLVESMRTLSGDLQPS